MKRQGSDQRGPSISRRSVASSGSGGANSRRAMGSIKRKNEGEKGMILDFQALNMVFSNICYSVDLPSVSFPSSSWSTNHPLQFFVTIAPEEPHVGLKVIQIFVVLNSQQLIWPGVIFLRIAGTTNPFTTTIIPKRYLVRKLPSPLFEIYSVFHIIKLIVTPYRMIRSQLFGLFRALMPAKARKLTALTNLS